jgi:hypothetical protein
MMAPLTSAQILLWSIWEHLLIPLLSTFTISIVVGAVAYFLAKVRARRELEIQKLKGQVDELREELSSTLALTGTLTIELSGSGPFELPLINQLNWLVPNEANRVIAGFRSEVGKRIYAGISYRALAQLINDHRAAPLSKETLSPLTLVDIGKPADAYALPVLSRLEGHFQRGRQVRILVFSSEDGQKILVPLSFEAYEQLLAKANAARIFYQEEASLHQIISRHRPTAAFSRR